jgi:hypothetical protein
MRARKTFVLNALLPVAGGRFFLHPDEMSEAKTVAVAQPPVDQPRLRQLPLLMREMRTQFFSS